MIFAKVSLLFEIIIKNIGIKLTPENLRVKFYQLKGGKHA